MTSETSPRSRTRRGLVDRELYEQAAMLFSTKGYDGTTLKDIADAVGMSRTSLYHYVDSKETLLARMVDLYEERTAQLLADTHEEVDAPPPERLRQLVLREVRDVTENPAELRLLDGDEGDLPAVLEERWTQCRQAISEAYVEIIEAGIADRSFRPVNAALAARAIMGMCSWLAWWYRPPTGREVTPLAETIAGIAHRSLAARSPAREQADASPAALITTARSYVDYLLNAPPGSLL